MQNVQPGLQATLWIPPPDAENQVLQIARWFTGWTEVERRIFFSQMLERVGPAAELAAAFGGIGFGAAQLPTQHPGMPQPSGLAVQLPWIWTWFESWPDRAKNQLVNTLEEIGPASTYEFYECFTAAEKEKAHALSISLGQLQKDTPPWGHEYSSSRGAPAAGSGGGNVGGGMEY